MAGCRLEMRVFVPRGYDHREITVKCGETSPTGYPWLCTACAKKHEHTDWKQQARDAGEAWDEDDY